MQFLTAMLGESAGTLLTAALSLGIVLVLIVLAVWGLKLTMKTGTAVARGRNRRLTIIDQLPVDGRRQLLIVRRDDVEHLILTGGPQDLVVETGIPVERPAVTATPPRRPAAETQTETPSGARNHLERLREMTRPAARQPSTIRHTGLLRPVSVAEPAVIPMPPIAGDNSGRAKADSATTPKGIEDNGRTGLGASRDISSERKADAP